MYSTQENDAWWLSRTRHISVQKLSNIRRALETMLTTTSSDDQVSHSALPFRRSPHLILLQLFHISLTIPPSIQGAGSLRLVFPSHEGPLTGKGGSQRGYRTKLERKRSSMSGTTGMKTANRRLV